MIARRTCIVCFSVYCLAVGALRADVADDQFTVAAGHFSAGRWQLAWTEFQTLLRDHPQHRRAQDARFFSGEALVQLRRWDDAVVQFRQLDAPNVPEQLARKALFRAGESNYFARHWDAARTDLQRWLKRWPDDKLAPYALVYLGDIALETEQPVDAERVYRQAVQSFPRSPLADDARLGLARALAHLAVTQPGQLAEAQKLLAEVRSHGDARLLTDALLIQAELQLAAGEFHAAERQFHEVLQHKPRAATADRARLGQAQALFQLHQFDAATQAIAGIAETSRYRIDALYWSGLVLQAQGEPLAAIAVWRSALVKGADHRLAPTIQLRLADALLSTGAMNEADAQFAEIVERRPQEDLADEAALGRLRVALARADHPAVAEQFQSLTQNYPQSSLYHVAAEVNTRSLLAQRRFDDALAQLQELGEAYTLAADRWPVQQLLAASVWRGLGQRELALDLITATIPATRAATRAEALWLQASVLVEMGRWSDAVRPLDDCRKLLQADASITSPDLASVCVQRTVCLARSGRLDEAERSWADSKTNIRDENRLVPAAEALADSAVQAAQPERASKYQHWLSAEDRPAAARAVGLAGQAWQAYRQGKLDQAQQLFQRVIDQVDQGSTAAEAHYLLGHLLQEQTPDEARNHLEQVERCDPNSPHQAAAWLALARIAEQQNQLDAAAALYQQVIDSARCAEQHDAAWYGLSWIRGLQGQTEASTAALEQIRTHHASSRYWHDAMYRLAERALQSGDDDACGRLLDELLAAKPPAAIARHALYLQAQRAIRVSRWADSTAPLTQLAEQKDDINLAHLAQFWLAEGDYRLGDSRAAGERFDQLAQIDSQERWARVVTLRRAQLAARAERWDDARQLIDELLTAQADFEPRFELDYVRGRCLAAAARFDDARAAFQQVIHSAQGAKTETAAMAQWMMGETYFHQRQYEAALREYLRVEILYAYPQWQAAALLEAAKCYEKLGQSSQAVETCVRLIKNFPDSPYRDEAARLLRSAEQTTEKR